MDKVKYVLFSIISLSLSFSCQNPNEKEGSNVTTFNFSDTTVIDSQLTRADESKRVLRIAVSAISSPRETFEYYREMFKYIETSTGMKVNMIQRKTYEEVNSLLKTNQVDLAFVCSGGYVYGKDEGAFELLAISERNGSRIYQTYIITHKNTDIQKLEDLKGKRFAFTDPLSTSGKLYPAKRIKELGSTPDDFFASYTYSYAHDNSIQLVSKQMVDGAAVNSLVFDFLAHSKPERVENIRIIEKSEWYGMPPIVVANGVSEELKAELKRIFLNIHNDKGSMNVLSKLMVDKYVSDSDTIYKSVRDMINFLDK